METIKNKTLILFYVKRIGLFIIGIGLFIGGINYLITNKSPDPIIYGIFEHLAAIFFAGGILLTPPKNYHIAE